MLTGVTESMAGFLAAEKLCQTELTESAVGRALSATERTREMHINGNGVAPRTIGNNMKLGIYNQLCYNTVL